MSLVGDLLSDLGAENGADHNQSSSNHPILNSSLQVEAESDLEDLELSLRALEKLDRSSPDLWPEQIPGVNQFIPATPTTNQSSPSQVQTKLLTSISIFLYSSPDIFFFIYPYTSYSIRVLSPRLFPSSLALHSLLYLALLIIYFPFSSTYFHTFILPLLLSLSLPLNSLSILTIPLLHYPTILHLLLYPSLLFFYFSIRLFSSFTPLSYHTSFTALSVPTIP